VSHLFRVAKLLRTRPHMSWDPRIGLDRPLTCGQASGGAGLSTGSLWLRPPYILWHKTLHFREASVTDPGGKVLRLMHKVKIRSPVCALSADLKRRACEGWRGEQRGDVFGVCADDSVMLTHIRRGVSVSVCVCTHTHTHATRLLSLSSHALTFHPEVRCLVCLSLTHATRPQIHSHTQTHTQLRT
jgi:hypothetical protein